jgi:septal ring factor EnvC (AmiA/AmiB activator)
MIRLVCILLILSAASAGWGESPNEELKGVRREIKVQRQLITKTRKVEAVVSTELQKIDRSLEQKIADLGGLNRDLLKVE